MEFFDEEIKKLQEDMLTYKRLEKQMAEMKEQYKAYEKNIEKLQAAYDIEAQDVEKLEKNGIEKFFYTVIGKIDEKMEKEREEAAVALLKLDVATEEMKSLKNEMFELQKEIQTVRDSETTYKEKLNEKLQKVKELGNPNVEIVFSNEQLILKLEKKDKEIEETLSPGYEAIATIDKMIDMLSDADGANSFDMYFSHSLFVHIYKNNKLEEAQRELRVLQSQLRRFKTELLDISINSNIVIELDNFTKYADYILDSFVIGCDIRDHIRNTISTLNFRRDEIYEVLEKLKSMKENNQVHIKRLKERNEELISAM